MTDSELAKQFKKIEEDRARKAWAEELQAQISPSLNETSVSLEERLKDIQNQLTLIDYKLNHAIDGIDQLFDFIDKKIDKLWDEL